jgi:preprotein translocase subunit SecD
MVCGGKIMKFTWRIWFLIIVLIISIISIRPSFEKGVLIKSVEQNSTAFESGLRQGQIIKQIDGKQVSSIEEYTSLIQKFPANEKTKLIITTDEQESILFTKNKPEITISNLPSTRIKFGLDLQGGSRALVNSEEKQFTTQELSDLIEITKERLNVYGLKEVIVKPISDLAGNNFMLIEIAGATPSELKELIAKQGKFEAKIGNEIVFVGGENDITHVGRTGQDALITECFEVQGGEACNFRFLIFLSEKAAQRHAQITSDLTINESSGGQYLSKQIDFYVDGVKTSSLNIGADLKGKVATQIQITGSEVGATRQEAFDSAKTEMKKLQTILITGSLPYKLNIAKLDTISPLLGGQFLITILIAGVSAICLVGVVIFIRYRKIKNSFALLFTSFSEIIIILGVASFIGWNLDLPSFAGILAVIGTGVDQQIVILDESRERKLSIKERLKRALFIIVSAYFTSLVALLPLYWAGAGLLKGFAITTIIGITTAVLITRPAFADIAKQLEED